MSTQTIERAAVVRDRPSEHARRCSGFEEFAGQTRECRAPATARISAGCLHEHIHDGWACERCAGEILAGRMGCGKCITCSDPHRCILVGRVVETRG